MLKDKCLLEDFDLVEEIEDRLGESICGGALAGFSLVNDGDYTLNYAVQAPGSKKWKKHTLAAGKGNLHYISNGGLLDWAVRYDNDLSKGADFVTQYLEPSIGTKSGIKQTAEYEFTQKGDLLTISEKSFVAGGAVAFY